MPLLRDVGARGDVHDHALILVYFATLEGPGLHHFVPEHGFELVGLDGQYPNVPAVEECRMSRAHSQTG